MDTIQKAYKFRLYPNKEQQVQIARTIGSCRYVYNHFLNKWNETYESCGKGLSYSKCSKALPGLKKSLEWLYEVDSTALQTALKHLDDGYKRFFKGLNDRPRFKSKRNPVQSYTSKYTNGNIRIHERIANIRLDYLHKVTSALVKNHDFIAIEDLNVEAMLKDKYLAKSVGDVSLSKLVELLVYKAKWYDRKIVKVNRHFPSSQLCSACGYKNSKVKNPAVRKWTCPSCQTRHDRDQNASINILKEGERIHLQSTVGTTGVA